MISNESLRMSWPKGGHCMIQGDEITIDRPVPERYNPFDYYNSDNQESVHLKFIAINENKIEEIINFIQKYGPLNYIVLYPENATGEPEQFMAFLNAPIKQISTIPDFKKEVIKMRTIVQLIEAISVKDIQLLIKGITDLEESAKVGDDDSLPWVSYVAMATIKQEVNKQLENTSPILGITHDLNLNDMSFRAEWRVDNLLSAMYVMLYMDLIQGKVFKKCQNQTCPAFFRIHSNDNRKIYCDNTCARQQAQREYRKRKKSKEHSCNY